MLLGQGLNYYVWSLGSLEPHSEVLQGAFSSEDLDIVTISLDLTFLLESSEGRLDDGGETVLSWDKDSLSSGKLGLGTSEGFTGVGDLIGSGSDGDENLTNSDTGDFAETLP